MVCLDFSAEIQRSGTHTDTHFCHLELAPLGCQQMCSGMSSFQVANGFGLQPYTESGISMDIFNNIQVESANENTS